MTSHKIFRIAACALVVCLLPAALGAADGGGAAGFNWGLWIAKILNALVFFGVIFYFLAPALKSMLNNRQKQIAEELAQAEMAIIEVRRRKEEAKAELAKLEGEAANIRARAKGEAEAERTRILEDAKRTTERMLEMAETQIAGAMRSAQGDLRKYAAKLSGEIAEEMVRKEINAKDKDALFEGGVKSLEVGA